MMNKILLADNQEVFRIGMAKILAGEFPPSRTVRGPGNAYCSPLMRTAPRSFCLLPR
jgi:hypothetical protein